MRIAVPEGLLQHRVVAVIVIVLLANELREKLLPGRAVVRATDHYPGFSMHGESFDADLTVVLLLDMNEVLFAK